MLCHSWLPPLHPAGRWQSVPSTHCRRVLGVPRTLQQEEGAGQAPASLHIRSALMVAVQRCMSWNGGAHAESTLQAMPADSDWLLLAPVAHDTQVHL